MEVNWLRCNLNSVQQWLPNTLWIGFPPAVSPQLGTIVRDPRNANATATSKVTVPRPSMERHLYAQTLDHFNYNPQSYYTFNHKYLVDFQYWAGPNSGAPIFVFFGGEAPLEPVPYGFLEENAPHFKALIVYIEHRFYGDSNPFGTMEEAMKNINGRGYFSSVQALADYAEIILHIKNKYSAQNSPVIVFGGSYGGMLASWFRLKYPHIALGALASSAPILNLVNLTPQDGSQDGYFSVVSKDFKDASQNCYKTIRESWAEIDRVASEPYGLSFLTQKFKTVPLMDAAELKEFLKQMYAGAAQYDAPPNYPVTEICRAIDGAPEGTGILDKIFAGVESFNQPCPGPVCFNMTRDPRRFIYNGWSWHECTDMVMPRGVTDEDSMFETKPFSLSQINDDCMEKFGIVPRPHWATTYYGGQDMKSVLKNSASNIIFSNGLRDPLSSGGVLEDISDSVLAVKTANGSHCLDISTPRADDPQWLIDQRKREIHIIRGWITKYNQDLRASQI